MKKIAAILLVLMTYALPIISAAADVKISELPLGVGALTGENDSVPYVQSPLNVTKRLKLPDLVNIPAFVAKYAPLASPTFTGTVTAPTFVGSLTGAASVTQSNLTAHTSDTNNPHAVTKAQVGLGSVLNLIQEPAITAGTTSQFWRGDKSWQTLDKAAVGLANVDNTSDANKPVSTATQTALNLKADSSTLTEHTGNTSNPHSVTKAQVGLGNVDNTSDATKNSAAAVLTNKDIDGGTASNSNRITLPKATKTTLDGLTRKEGTLVYATDAAKAYVDNGSALVAVGSGSGSGGVNYDSNSTLETDLTGYAFFNNNGALTTGTGDTGANDGSIQRTTTAPLNPEGGSLLYTPGALAGQGWSYDFTVGREALASVLSIEFSYEIATSTNFTDGDLKVAIYDKDAGALVQILEGEQIKKVTGPYKHIAKFQTHVTDVNYRLIVYQSTSVTSYGSVKFDSIKVGPQNTPRGPPVSDWVSFSPTITPSTNINLNYARYRRVGDSVELQVGYAWAGAGAASTIYITLPPGLMPDISKIYNGGTVGTGFMYSSTTGFNTVTARIDSPNVIYFAKSGSGSSLQGSDGPASGSALYYTALVPISGWSSNVAFSSDESGRIVAARLGISAAQTVSAAGSTKVLINTAAFDTVGGLNTTSNRYDIKENGKYRVFFQARYINVASSVNTYIQNIIQKNGVNDSAGYLYYTSGTPTDPATSVASVIDAKVGDYLEFLVASNDTSYQVDNQAFQTYITIEKIQGNQTIAASDTVAVRAGINATQTITGTGTVLFGGVVRDTHNAFSASTGIFTAPSTGSYLFEGAVMFDTATWNAGTRVDLAVGGAYAGRANEMPATAAIYRYIPFKRTVYMTAGSTTTVYVDQNSGSSKNILNNSGYTWLTITKVAN